MLKYRVLTSLVLLPLAVAGVFELNLLGFALVMGAILLLGAWEWGNLAGLSSALSRGIYTGGLGLLMAVLLLTDSAGVPLSLWPGMFWWSQNAIDLPLLLVVLGLVWWLVAILLVLTYPKSSAVWHRIKLPAGILLLLAAWVALVSLRATQYLQNPYRGAFILLLMLLVIWGADTGAYFAGKAFGRHKLAPKVSPGKTWQGFAGAVVVGTLLTWPGLWLLKWPVTAFGPLWLLIELTVVISVFGDLLESLAKRERGVKDSGRLLPGHGGILDRIDSLVAAAPVFVVGMYWLSSTVRV